MKYVTSKRYNKKSSPCRVVLFLETPLFREEFLLYREVDFFDLTELLNLQFPLHLNFKLQKKSE